MHDLPRLSRGVDYIIIQSDPDWSSASDSEWAERYLRRTEPSSGLSVISRYGVKGACIAFLVSYKDESNRRTAQSQRWRCRCVVGRLRSGFLFGARSFSTSNREGVQPPRREMLEC